MKLIIVIACIVVVTAEDYQENIEDYVSDENSSVDSQSNEVFTNSTRDRPERITSKEVKLTSTTTTATVNKTLEEKRTPKDLPNYSFSVSIQKKNSHYASGALISLKWILTAAAEFYYVRESIKLFRARFGTVNCKKGGTLRALKGVEVHPMYVISQPQYDVALLRLAQPITLNDAIIPIPISNNLVRSIGTKFLTTYWPRLIINGQVLPSSAKERTKQNNMRVSTQKLVPWDKCSKVLDSANCSLNHASMCLEPIVTHHTICTTNWKPQVQIPVIPNIFIMNTTVTNINPSPFNKIYIFQWGNKTLNDNDSHFGTVPDVGAPVLADDVLWGITSGWTSPDCATKNSPTLFTKLSARDVRFWLDSYIADM